MAKKRAGKKTAESEKPAKRVPCRLYLISPAALEPDIFAPLLQAALAAGDVASFQLRLKDVPDQAVRDAVRVLMPICHRNDVAFILNDHPRLAAELDTDGVHIGQDDGDYATARAAVGPNRLVGVTCHDSRHLAMEAAEAGADYIAFGAFYPTTTKVTEFQADLDALAWWADIMEVPCVAIGGITAENCGPLVRAGADFLAVCGAVWNHAHGPAAAVAELNAAIARAEAERAAGLAP